MNLEPPTSRGDRQGQHSSDAACSQDNLPLNKPAVLHPKKQAHRNLELKKESKQEDRSPEDYSS